MPCHTTIWISLLRPLRQLKTIKVTHVHVYAQRHYFIYFCIEVISSILKGGEEQLINVVVKPIQNEVYERVDAFLEQGEVFLNLEKSKGNEENQYPFLEKYINDLKEMKSGESSTFSGKGSRLSNDKGIVPISALIVGFLYRLEYEHSTALSHWSHRS